MKIWKDIRRLCELVQEKRYWEDARAAKVKDIASSSRRLKKWGEILWWGKRNEEKSSDEGKENRSFWVNHNDSLSSNDDKRLSSENDKISFTKDVANSSGEEMMRDFCTDKVKFLR